MLKGFVTDVKNLRSHENLLRVGIGSGPKDAGTSPGGRERAMKKTRFTEEHVVTILREADQRPIAEVAKKHARLERLPGVPGARDPRPVRHLVIVKNSRLGGDERRRQRSGSRGYRLVS